MVILHYLAMTAAEIQGKIDLPSKIGYLSCRFSQWDRGLTNLPESLPPGQMLILDDAIPMDGHDPEKILAQLRQTVEKNQCESLLLDFQRPESRETAELARTLVKGLTVPVGVSQGYAQGLDCPVFVAPIPPDVRPEEHLASWKHRELWLDAARNGEQITLTEKGAQTAPLTYFPGLEDGFAERELCCHYRIALEKEMARFTLFRTVEDVAALCLRVGSLGVTKAVSLWQEMKKKE